MKIRKAIFILFLANNYVNAQSINDTILKNVVLIENNNIAQNNDDYLIDVIMDFEKNINPVVFSDTKLPIRFFSNQLFKSKSFILITPNSTLKSLKKQPKTKISSLEIYNYKKQDFESFYGKTLRSKIKIVENDDMTSGEIMFIKINKDYLGVSVESEIKQEFCAEIDYPEPTKLMYTKTKNSLIIDNSVQKNNNKYQLLSLTLRKEKMFGKVRVENKIEEFEFK